MPKTVTVNVTANDVTYTGLVAGETIVARGSNDTIIAGPAHETLNAVGVNDTLEGAVGSATFAGDSTTTLIALPDPNATVQGVAIGLGNDATPNSMWSGVTFNGPLDLLSFPTSSTQHLYTGDLSGINKVIIDSGGDNALLGNNNGDVLEALGNGENFIQGGEGNDTLMGGSGQNFFFGEGGNNTLIGGSGTNIYFEDWGSIIRSGHNTIDSFHNDVITNFDVATDSLQFSLNQTTGQNEAPTSWNLVTVGGVESLEAVLGDGTSTLTLIGVTDPSLIHMFNWTPSSGPIPIPDVLLASHTLASAHDLHVFG